MFKILDEACTPKRGTKYSAAIDLYAREDVVIGAGETKIIPLGVCIDLEEFDQYLYLNNLYPIEFYKTEKPSIAYHFFENFIKSHYLQLEPRSSLRAKGLIAGTGIIDMDYQDEIKIILHNPTKTIDIARANYAPEYKLSCDLYEIKKGDKVAQIMLKEHKGHLLGYETETKRSGGFGSTGA